MRKIGVIMPTITTKSDNKVKHSSFISVSQLLGLAKSSYNARNSRFEQSVSLSTLKDCQKNGILNVKGSTPSELQKGFHTLSFWEKLPIIAYEFGYEWARNQTPQTGIVYKNISFNLYTYKRCEVQDFGFTQYCQLDYQFTTSISISPSEMQELTGESADSLYME